MTGSIVTYVGIDPGLSGAIAVMDADGVGAEVWDMPTLGGEVNPTQLGTLLRSVHAPYATIEDVHSMPKQGVKSSFGFGVSKGIALGVLGALGIPYVRVTSSAWKRDMRVTSDKATALRLANERWPSLAEDLRLKKHDGRAEALLIADWGRRVHRFGGM